MVSITPLNEAFEEEIRAGERLEFGMEWCLPREALGNGVLRCLPMDGGAWSVGVGPGAAAGADNSPPYYWSAFASLQDATEQCSRVQYFLRNKPIAGRPDFWFDYYRDSDEREALREAASSRAATLNVSTRATSQTAATFLGEFLGEEQNIAACPTLVLLDAADFTDFLEGIFSTLPLELGPPGCTGSGVGEEAGMTFIYWDYGRQRVFCSYTLSNLIVTPDSSVWDLRQEPHRGAVGKRIVTFEFLAAVAGCTDTSTDTGTGTGAA